MKKIWNLFVSFFKIGLFTFGGGYAMLPMLQREVVEKHGWVTEDDILDYYAIGQCTPGVIAVNTATFVGEHICGVLGSAVATVAVVMPSLIIILLISTVLQSVSQFEIVQHALAGIRVGVAALIVVSVAKLFKKGVKDLLGYILFAVSLLAIVLFELSPIWMVLAAIAVGVIKALKGGEKA
jgi:chromate transporter